MMVNADITPDDILRDHTSEVRAVAEPLRRLIHDTIDGMTETAYPGRQRQEDHHLRERSRQA